MIAVYVLPDIKRLSKEISRVKTVKFQLGKGVDYVVAFSAVEEKELKDFVCANEDKEYKKIKKEGFNIWLCDPEKKTIVSYFNAPRDEVLRENIENRRDIVEKEREGNRR